MFTKTVVIDGTLSLDLGIESLTLPTIPSRDYSLLGGFGSRGVRTSPLHDLLDRFQIAWTSRDYLTLLGSATLEQSGLTAYSLEAIRPMVRNTAQRISPVHIGAHLCPNPNLQIEHASHLAFDAEQAFSILIGAMANPGPSCPGGGTICPSERFFKLTALDWARAWDASIRLSPTVTFKPAAFATQMAAITLASQSDWSFHGVIDTVPPEIIYPGVPYFAVMAQGKQVHINTSLQHWYVDEGGKLGHFSITTILDCSACSAPFAMASTMAALLSRALWSGSIPSGTPIEESVSLTVAPAPALPSSLTFVDGITIGFASAVALSNGAQIRSFQEWEDLFHPA